MPAAKGGTTFYVSTEPQKRPPNHGKKCECDRCKAAGLRVRAPNPQLALTRAAVRLGIPVLPELPPPPAPPPSPAPEPAPPKPKRALPPLPAQPPPPPTYGTPAAIPPGGFKAWLNEQRKKS